MYKIVDRNNIVYHKLWNEIYLKRFMMQLKQLKKVMGNKTWFFYPHQMINMALMKRLVMMILASDEEVGDDDIGLAGNIDLPTDVTGVVEVHCANVDSDDDDDSDEPADDVRWAFLRINLKL